MEYVPFSLSEQLIYYGVAILYLLKTTYPLAVQKIKKTMKRFVPHFPIYVVAAFLLITSVSLSGCSQNELPGGDDNDTLHCTALTVQVTDGGYSSAEGTHPDTRATENGYKTQFTTGDKIGLYAVKNSAIVTGYTNLCLTLTDDGNGNLSWKLPEGSGLWYEGASAGITYYAYYPYQPDADMTDKVTPTATDASGFFTELEEKWAPATDQSTPAAYTAQDLMTGIGTVSGNGMSHTLTFNFTHQMALAVIKTPITKYELKDASGISLPDYTLPAPDLTFNGFAPCAMSDGSYRYLVNPCLKQSQPQLSGSYTNSDKTQEFIFTPDIDTGTYKTYTVDNGSMNVIEKTHILQAGDFYMKDGSLVGKDENLTAAQQAACIGIVFYVGDPTKITPANAAASISDKTQLQGDATLKAFHPNCTHGVVVALQDAGSKTTWQNLPVNVQDWLNTSSNNNYTTNGGTSGSYLPVLSGPNSDAPVNNIQGYNNTKAIEAFNVAPANSSNKVTPVELVVDYRKKVSVPQECSGWYLPSAKELTLLCGTDVSDIWNNHSGGTDNRDLMNTQLGKASGTSLQSYYYWSSTEYDGSWAWSVYFYYGNVYYDRKRSNWYGVRAVLAF